jgi:tRNA(Ile)-lysidine synthase
VAHLNHAFRPEADAEARFVEKLSIDRKIPFTSIKLPVPQLCKEKGLSKQEGARTIRYQFLTEVAQDVGARWIALGHTADDQAETFLMRTLRGAGAQGLGAIPIMREGYIIRPLLKVTRREILSELSIENISFMEDPSNLQPIYLRNRIRHELLPTLEQYNPQIKEALCREAVLLHDENDFIHRHLLSIIPTLKIQTAENSVQFDAAEIQSLHPALQRRLLRWGIDQLGIGLKGISFKHIETIRSKILSGPAGKSYSFPHFLKIQKRYSTLLFERADDSDPIQVKSRPPLSAELPLPEREGKSAGIGINLPPWGVKLTASLHPGAQPSFSPCMASFDFDTISLPLFIRSWQPGDSFMPAGMQGRHKKLQDFFVDAKIAKSERGQRAILTSSQGILWVVGLRVDERFRINERTKRTLMMEAEEISF